MSHLLDLVGIPLGWMVFDVVANYSILYVADWDKSMACPVETMLRRLTHWFGCLVTWTHRLTPSYVKILDAVNQRQEGFLHQKCLAENLTFAARSQGVAKPSASSYRPGTIIVAHWWSLLFINNRSKKYCSHGSQYEWYDHPLLIIIHQITRLFKGWEPQNPEPCSPWNWAWTGTGGDPGCFFRRECQMVVDGIRWQLLILSVKYLGWLQTKIILGLVCILTNYFCLQ